MKYLLVFILCFSQPAFSDSFSDTFNTSCIKKEKLKCGKDDLSKIPPDKLTQKQKQIVACRITALYKCMKKNNK